uniref:hypothetical protein n=1 Tax=Bradyrhizobium sp. (strain ORS 278) TaxID=114615 RepID=UPI0012FEAEB4|nr:hypothetical protein [Bradyrhizobium sp. ORS 278]
MWKATFFFCGLICVSPGLGLVSEALAVGISAVTSAAALIWIALAIRPRELAFVSQIGMAFLAAASLLPIWMAFQTLPLGVLAHPVWLQAADALQHPLNGSVTIDAGLTVRTILICLAGLCVAIVAAAIAVDSRRASWLAGATLASGIAHGVTTSLEIALARAGNEPAMSPLVPLLIIQVGVADALEVLGTRKSTIRALALPAAAVASSLLLLGFIARDRALVAALAGLFIVSLVWAFKRFRAPAFAAAATAASLIGLAAFTMVALRPNPELPLVIGFADQQDGNLQRSLAVLADAPALGTGAGTLAALLPTYSESSTESRVALSTAAAGFVVEFGKFAALVFAAGLMVLVGIFFLGALDRGRDWFYCAAAGGGLVALMVGSFRMPTMFSTSDVFVLGTVLGCAISQRVSRTRSQDF